MSEQSRSFLVIRGITEITPQAYTAARRQKAKVVAENACGFIVSTDIEKPYDVYLRHNNTHYKGWIISDDDLQVFQDQCKPDALILTHSAVFKLTPETEQVS